MRIERFFLVLVFVLILLCVVLICVVVYILVKFGFFDNVEGKCIEFLKYVGVNFIYYEIKND